MILQVIVDGEQLREILNNLVSVVTAVFIQVLAAGAQVGFDFFSTILLGTFYSNPAVLIIALFFALTAWKVSQVG